MSLEYFRTLTEYNYDLHARVWDSIMQLTEEQFLDEVDYSHGSIRNQMLHIAETDKNWLLGLQENPLSRQFKFDEMFTFSRDGVYELWDVTSNEFKDYVNSLTESDLERVPKGMLGPIWQVILHVMNHGTDHRAQVLRILHDFGAPTFDQDLVLHLWRP